MAKCIYCLREDNICDRDHVLPEAYGTFAPVSFVLYETVCKSCNGEFGRSIELSLSRDSMEALLRFRYGTKAASEARDLPYHRLELKVGQAGPLSGATVMLETDATGNAVEPVPLPQVTDTSAVPSEQQAASDLFAGAIGPFKTQRARARMP